MNDATPAYISRILTRLGEKDHAAFLVGGCVRDMLRCVRPKDYDIATDALPEEIVDIFPRTVPTGEKYGTVTVFSGRGRAEVTTFRAESGYSDKRRPDGVTFVRNISEDLSRRDFTINAMAMDAEGRIIDLFGGREDVENKIIRCVGDAQTRFSEDALRMLRAVRFSAQLGFTIVEQTESAIKKLAHTARSLSRERVRTELVKTLLSDRPETAGMLVEYGLLGGYIENDNHIDLSGLSRVRRDDLHRLSAMASRLTENGNIPSPDDFLRKLGIGSKTALIVRSAHKASFLPLKTERDILSALHRFGKPAVLLAASMKTARGEKNPVRRVNACLRGGRVWSYDGLCLNGHDLVSLGITGKAVGECMEILLSAVMEDKTKNNRENLLEILASRGYNITPQEKRI